MVAGREHIGQREELRHKALVGLLGSRDQGAVGLWHPDELALTTIVLDAMAIRATPDPTVHT